MNEHVARLLTAFDPYFEARYETERRYASMQPPRRDFVIFMTPRSGSTWLSQLLIKHGGFGQPEEWLNPDHIATDIAQTESASLDRYLGHVRKLFRDSRTGVFGVEVSYFHLELMEHMASFFNVFAPNHTHFFYLTRRDIVAQAVSLYKATELQIWNSLEGDSDDAKLHYDEAELLTWTKHLLEQEDGFERMFAAMELRPVRLVYEDMIKAGPERTCRFFCNQLGVEYVGTPEETIRKVGTGKNEEFAQRLVSSMDLQWLRTRRIEGVL